jgi:hypothetical protein
MSTRWSTSNGLSMSTAHSVDELADRVLSGASQSREYPNLHDRHRTLLVLEMVQSRTLGLSRLVAQLVAHNRPNGRRVPPADRWDTTLCKCSSSCNAQKVRVNGFHPGLSMGFSNSARDVEWRLISMKKNSDLLSFSSVPDFGAKLNGVP